MTAAHSINHDVGNTLDDKNNNITALIIDDSPVDRLILQRYLLRLGFDVHIATDGHMGVHIFDEQNPDIVFIDLYLPDMNGKEIAIYIKNNSKDIFVPVMFVTGASDSKSLEDCLNFGGDDFITKPILESLLKARVQSLLRIKLMHDQNLREKEKIAHYFDAQSKDMLDANKIIQNIQGPLFYNPGNIKFSLIARYIFSGDLLCSAISPTGTHTILIGDNTGHGLPAAIGSLVIHEAFYTMVRKGFELESIVEEINRKLLRLLPTDRFFAACMIEIDADYLHMKIWNAGIPSVFVCDTDGVLKHRFPSMHMPLGIKSIAVSEVIPVRYEVNNQDRIYAYTDGLIECFNSLGEMFGEGRLLESIEDSNKTRQFEDIIKRVEAFRGKHEEIDDILLIEIVCDKSLTARKIESEIKVDIVNPMHWNMTLDIQADTIRQTNPVPILIQTLTELQGLQNHREKLFLILMEMYSNALEHGLLNIDSSIKSDTDGFLKYYEMRKERLKEINDARLTIDIEHYYEGSKGVVSISVEHNGEEFNYGQGIPKLENNYNKSGRGRGLISELCRTHEYSKNGRHLRVEYEWEYKSLEKTN